MKKNDSFAFTIAELIITTIIMAIILIVAPVVFVKRSTKDSQAKQNEKTALCSEVNCIFSAADSVLKTKHGDIKWFDYNRKNGSFYTIELIGGGGGGNSSAGGCNGEYKRAVLMSLYKNDFVTNPENKGDEATYKGILTGFYLLVPGKGGDSGHAGQDSIFCVISPDEAKQSPDSLSCDDETKIIAIAQGGISSNETQDCETGYSTTPGKGGAKGAKGQNGQIEIK